MKHEPIENEFSRKSKRYRTKYFEQLGILFGDAVKAPRIDQDESKNIIHQKVLVK